MAKSKGKDALVVHRDTSHLHKRFSEQAVTDEATHREKFRMPPTFLPPPRPRPTMPPVPAVAPAKSLSAVIASKPLAKKASK